MRRDPWIVKSRRGQRKKDKEEERQETRLIEPERQAGPSWRELKSSPGCLLFEGRRACWRSGVESRTSQV